MREVFLGFDSAWTDNTRSLGALCAVVRTDGEFTECELPRLTSFSDALAFISHIHQSDGLTIVAIVQPTIVRNATGMRPVDRVAASLISWLGGGVQPANRGKSDMFGDGAPIWRFLSGLNGTESPEAARTAKQGLFYIEVFPALALPSLGEEFCGRLLGPRYDPQRRKTFRLEHWRNVVAVVVREAERLGCAELASWIKGLSSLERPTKADQDRLDASTCALVAIRWRLDPHESSAMLGDLGSGYMITPIASATARLLHRAALKYGVPMDGQVVGK